MKMCVRFVLCCAVLLGSAIGASAQAGHPASTFHNPLLDRGPDPWIITANGFYYYMDTTGKDLVVRRARDITDLAHADKKAVRAAPASSPCSKDIRAPELHRLDGKWYVYCAADDGVDELHRIDVIENPANDPLEGEPTFRGKVGDATDRWAIDASVFEDRGRNYMIRSGWEGDTHGEQRIYNAHFKNPWTVLCPKLWN